MPVSSFEGSEPNSPAPGLILDSEPNYYPELSMGPVVKPPPCYLAALSVVPPEYI